MKRKKIVLMQTLSGASLNPKPDSTAAGLFSILI